MWRFFAIHGKDFSDSWSYIRTPDGTILNLNDCTVNTPEEVEQVKSLIGAVDVLLTQFSISAWDGNIEDLERRKSGARTMLERTHMQANLFDAKYLIPFASYIWFCHEENAYMNEAFLPIREVASTLEEKADAKTIFLYPSDTWEMGADHDSTSAIEKYSVDQESIPNREFVKTRPCI